MIYYCILIISVSFKVALEAQVVVVQEAEEDVKHLRKHPFKITRKFLLYLSSQNISIKYCGILMNDYWSGTRCR